MRSEDHQLWLDPLTEDTWRLCDRSASATDPDSVVAYVEQRRDGRYEVTWVAHGIRTGTYTTMGELLTDAAELIDDGPRQAWTKPVPIPHRPPPHRAARWATR